MRINFMGIQMQTWNDNSGFLYKDPQARKGFWIRFFGWGIHVKRGQLTFSERNEYKRFIALPFGYRLSFLKREKNNG